MGRFDNITGNKYNHLIVLGKTDKKRGSSYLWECVCDCEKAIITYATKAELESGHKKSCGCIHQIQRSKLGKSKAKDLTNKIFGDLKVLEKTDIRRDGRVVWKCECLACGNKDVKVKSSDLTQGKKTHCGCKMFSSKGEQKIIELLNYYGFSFVREKSFPDLTHNGKKLRYDFYVEDTYLIEYDGKQHFIKDSGYGADIENIQFRDSLKNEYAKKKHIPLIRIKYQNYNNFTIDDIVVESLKYKIKYKKEGNEL